MALINAFAQLPDSSKCHSLMLNSQLNHIQSRTISVSLTAIRIQSQALEMCSRRRSMSQYKPSPLSHYSKAALSSKGTSVLNNYTQKHSQLKEICIFCGHSSFRGAAARTRAMAGMVQSCATIIMVTLTKASQAVVETPIQGRRDDSRCPTGEIICPQAVSGKKNNKRRLIVRQKSGNVIGIKMVRTS